MGFFGGGVGLDVGNTYEAAIENREIHMIFFLKFVLNGDKKDLRRKNILRLHQNLLILIISKVIPMGIKTST